MSTASPSRRSHLAAVQLAPNPGPMTLDGTNSYLLAAPASPSRMVVDPGPADTGHLAALAAHGPVELILITHRHLDHTAGAAELARLTGAPVRAADPAQCINAAPLQDGERIEAGGVVVTVLATPGHTDDSVCFLLDDDRPVGSEDGNGSVLTGDTILGRGTTVIAPPDGSLGGYLESLERLVALGPRLVLPAHGPTLPDLAAVAGDYLAHRMKRLAAVRAALDILGPAATVAAVTDVVYTDIDPSVRFAAEYSVAAQLEYLRAQGSGQREA